MDLTNWIIVGVIAAIGVAATVALIHYKKKNVEKLFLQVYETSRQVPKAKKNSFLLLMFKETLSSSTSKAKAQKSMTRLNNPKYLEIQMMQMSKILKDSSNVKDKTMKRSLRMLTDYLAWEEEKRAKDKQAAQEKAA